MAEKKFLCLFGFPHLQKDKRSNFSLMSLLILANMTLTSFSQLIQAQHQPEHPVKAQLGKDKEQGRNST